MDPDFKPSSQIFHNPYRGNQLLQFKGGTNSVQCIGTIRYYNLKSNEFKQLNPELRRYRRNLLKNRLDKLLIEFILYYVRTKNGIFGKLQILILFL